MAKIIKTNGEIAEITPKNEKNGFTCEELYAEIGNGCELVEVALRYDEAVEGKETSEQRIVIVDEEGVLPDENGKPRQRFNWKASAKFIEEFHQPILLCGNVIICSPQEFQ